jgi:hypothetical protein
MVPPPALANNTQQMTFKEEEYQENDLGLPNSKKFQSESYQDNNGVKVRTSIGSCGEDDSGVVNSISTDGTGSLSNTPPTVYQSPDRVDNSNLYPGIPFPNSYYYKQNYTPYPMMPTIINTNNETPYQSCYGQPSLGNFGNHPSQHHFNQAHSNMYAKDFYNSNFMHQQSSHQNIGYYNNMNMGYGYGEGIKYQQDDSSAMKTQISQQKTSSPIQVPLGASSINNQPEINLTNITHQNKNNPKIKTKLQDMSLWKSFHEIGTEMIITKTGRYCYKILKKIKILLNIIFFKTNVSFNSSYCIRSRGKRKIHHVY